MLKKGQLEDKEANQFKNEIDMMIVALNNHNPDIKLKDQLSSIIGSVLSEIFTKEDIEKAYKGTKFEEKPYTGKDLIVKEGKKNYDKIIYVSRGAVIEKSGDYEASTIEHIRFKNGQIACLQNLLPSNVKEHQITDVYAHNSAYVQIIELDVTYLRQLLIDYPDKLIKFWEKLAYRMIIIHYAELGNIDTMKKEKIKNLCKVC